VNDDALLARAAANGDVAAFTRLVRRHESSLRNFLSRLCGGAGADDLAQEVFMRAWRLARSYRGEGEYRAWLFRIAWRVYLTSRARVRPTLPFDPDAHGGAFAPDPAVRIDVDRALARLGPRERAASILCFGEGLSHSEAASSLRLPLGTLKSILARARQELIDYLKAEEHE
jgi:RNA polymerase sigma factor (sigma-70 family)